MDPEKVQKLEAGCVEASCYAGLFEQGDHIETQYPLLDDTRSIGWSGKILAAFSETPAGSGPNTTTTTYAYDDPKDALGYSEMACKIPALKLKKEYAKDHRFKLCNYFGYAMSVGELSSGPKFKFTLTPQAQVALFSTLLSKQDTDRELRRMGMLTVCARWCTSMPGDTYYYRQMWGYGLYPEKSLQLWMMKAVTHKYVHSLRIKNYINVQRFDPQLGQYVDIPCNMELFEEDPIMDSPGLYGEFRVLTVEEKEKWKSKHLSTFYIHDMIPLGEGDAMTVSLGKSMGLSQAVYFFLENKTRDELNHKFNYTRDTVPTVDSRSGIVSAHFSTKAYEDSGVPASMYIPRSNVYVPGLHQKLYVDKIGHGNQGGSLVQATGASVTCGVSPKKSDTNEYKLHVLTLVVRKYAVDLVTKEVSVVPDFA